MSDTLGWACKALRSAALIGSGETPLTIANATWTEINEVGDVDIDDGLITYDRRTRGNAQFSSTGLAGQDTTVTFTIPWVAADADFIALRAAKATRVPVALLFLDLAFSVTGATGVGGNWTVTSWTENEPLNGRKTVSIAVKPYDHTAEFTKQA